MLLVGRERLKIVDLLLLRLLLSLALSLALALLILALPLPLPLLPLVFLSNPCAMATLVFGCLQQHLHRIDLSVVAHGVDRGRSRREMKRNPMSQELLF